MQTIQTLTKAQKKKALERILRSFILFCKFNFGFDLYDYEVKLARACLSSILVEPKDIYCKIARQSGKTEIVTLLMRFLMVFYLSFMGAHLMAGIASPKGEQAKTDVDRIKKSIAKMRRKWAIEDREFNSNTVRAYIDGILHAEIYKFSLAPTTTNESKTLNLLLVEEAHKVDDQKRSDQLDPMLSSTGGITWQLGVGCTRLCDYYAGCKGELPDSEVIIVPVDEVIKDKQKMYKKTKDPIHLEYKKAFERELRKKGRENPEIKRNYYLEDSIEEGNFVSRERLLRCSRTKDIESELYYLGIDWARSSDKTWITLGNNKNDIIGWFCYPSVRYEEQIELMMNDLEPYKGRIVGVCGDSTGLGDFPMEYLEGNTWLPIDDASKVKFTLQSKNEMYTNFDAALFKEDDDEQKFSYPADDPLTAEFEEQMTLLEREYKGDGEYLTPHHPDKAGMHDDACDATALMLLAGMDIVGDISFV